MDHSHALSPAFRKQSYSLIRAQDENSRNFLLGFQNLAVDFVKFSNAREALFIRCFTKTAGYVPKHRVFPDHLRSNSAQARTPSCRWTHSKC